MSLRLSPVLALALALAACAPPQPPPAAGPEACFRPGGASCEALLASKIGAATRSIEAEVYQFTLPSLAEALIDAHRRGVDVRVTVDRTSARGNASQVPTLAAAAVPLWCDPVHGIHHDKVLIVDRHIVCTGSFNWSRNAEHRNAENLICLDDPALAARYGADFEQQIARAVPGPECPARPRSQYRK